MDSALDTVYKGIRFLTDRILGNIASVGLLGGTLFAIYEVFRRYIFGVVHEWGQDFVIYVIIGSVFLYFAVTQAKRAHLVMSAFTDLLRGRGFEKTVIFLRLCVSSFSLFFFRIFLLTGASSGRTYDDDRAYLSKHVSSSLAVPGDAASFFCSNGLGHAVPSLSRYPCFNG